MPVFVGFTVFSLSPISDTSRLMKQSDYARLNYFKHCLELTIFNNSHIACFQEKKH